MTQDIRITRTDRKLLVTTSNPFEQKFGYHRAVRRGPFIAVSGTTALKVHISELSDQGEDQGDAETESTSAVHHPGDVFNQAILSLNRAIEAVICLDGHTEDIVRVRMFVARSKDCEAVGAAFRQCFGMHKNEKGRNRPDARADIVAAAATMIVVPGAFVQEGILVEIEVDAYVL